MILKKKYCGLVLTVALLAGIQFTAMAAPGFLLPDEAVISQKSADVTGDQVADKIYLVGINEAKTGLNRGVNVVVADGANKEISRSLFNRVSGYRGTLEIGDFNGDKIDDVLFTLQKSDLTPKTYIVAFNQATPQIIFQATAEAEEIEVRTGDVAITPADNAQTVQVKKDSVIQLQLPENPSTGYTWQFTQSTGGECVTFLGQESLIPTAEPQMVGKPGLRVFSFKAQKTGTVEMVLANYRIWEGNAAAIDNFKVVINIVN